MRFGVFMIAKDLNPSGLVSTGFKSRMADELYIPTLHPFDTFDQGAASICCASLQQTQERPWDTVQGAKFLNRFQTRYACPEGLFIFTFGVFLL